MRGVPIFVVLIAVVLCSCLSDASAETFGTKKRRLKPHEYGSVVINNFSAKKEIAPAVFPHWLHRAKYTCRLCHVDIGFAMKAGQTGITEQDNLNGLYCGACHNGKESFASVERQIIGGEVKNCDKCHSLGKEVKFKNDFYAFKKTMPAERFGSGIDWLKAEEGKLITLKDSVEGVSFKRDKFQDPEKLTLASKEPNMPEIIFSHTKHSKWNGCELCHPEIFGIKKGATKYTMQDIFNDKYCGACHGIVAFPNSDCRRCHTKEVY